MILKSSKVPRLFNNAGNYQRGNISLMAEVNIYILSIGISVREDNATLFSLSERCAYVVSWLQFIFHRSRAIPTSWDWSRWRWTWQDYIPRLLLYILITNAKKITIIKTKPWGSIYRSRDNIHTYVTRLKRSLMVQYIKYQRLGILPHAVTAGRYIRTIDIA